MKAAFLQDVGAIEIRSVPTVRPSQASEVVARVLFIGICRTDGSLCQSPTAVGLVLGHEVVCTLDDKVEGATPTVYALNNEIPCGTCTYCLEALTSHCENLEELGVNRHGGYAEYLLTPRANLQRFDGPDPALAVFVEPLSCALHAVDRLQSAASLLSSERPSVVIFGGGISGQLIAFALRHRNFPATIALFDPSPAPLPWAEDLDCERLLSPPVERAHLAIECSGTSEGLASAIAAARKGGVVCLYGIPPDGDSPPVSMNDLFRREVSLIPSVAGATASTIAEAAAAIAQRPSFFARMIGRFVPLEALDNELREWRPNPGTRTIVTLGARRSPSIRTPER